MLARIGAFAALALTIALTAPAAAQTVHALWEANVEPTDDALDQTLRDTTALALSTGETTAWLGWTATKGALDLVSDDVQLLPAVADFALSAALLVTDAALDAVNPQEAGEAVTDAITLAAAAPQEASDRAARGSAEADAYGDRRQASAEDLERALLEPLPEVTAALRDALTISEFEVTLTMPPDGPPEVDVVLAVESDPTPAVVAAAAYADHASAVGAQHADAAAADSVATGQAVGDALLN